MRGAGQALALAALAHFPNPCLSSQASDVRGEPVSHSLLALAAARPGVHLLYWQTCTSPASSSDSSARMAPGRPCDRGVRAYRRIVGRNVEQLALSGVIAEYEKGAAVEVSDPSLEGSAALECYEPISTTPQALQMRRRETSQRGKGPCVRGD